LAISLLPCPLPRKVTEQTLDTISKDKKVTETSQNGYIKGKSCLTNLTALRDEKTGSAAEGRAGGVGHPDFMSKAMTVSHGILRTKVLKCGLDNQTIKVGEIWLESGQARRIAVSSYSLHLAASH